MDREIKGDIRVLTSAAELERAAEIFYTALVAWPVPADAVLADAYQPGRCLGVFQQGELVGTATSFSSWLAVPGGARVPHAAVTDVGVLPSHTRQGLAGALLRRQLQDAAERGDAVATLRASEATIYERFGYGVATSAATVQVSLRTGGLRASVPPAGPVRLVDPATSWDLLAKIYDPIRHPGAIERHSYWWRGLQHHMSRNKDAQYIAVHGEPGAEDGFVRYQPTGTDGWFNGKDRTIVANDLIALTDTAYLGLLRFLFTIDLVEQVELPTMPVDHSLSALMTNGRAACTTSIYDETWLRLIDVETALAARTYTGPESVVIDVRDDLLPQNTGRYRVSSGGAERTDAAAELSLDVATLAALYLGATTWWQLARAGRIAEHAPSALARADALFATPRAPFSGTMF